MTNTPDHPTTSVDLDFIVDTIKEEKCILFIGPELFTSPQHGNMQERLNAFLKVEGNDDILTYYEYDGFYLFKSAAAKTKAYYRIKKFYQGSFKKGEYLLDMIARIPFHAIISVSPDEAILKSFQKQHFKYKFDFYWKNQKHNDLATPTKKNPLIYNVFGSIREEESLILTHDDLYDYFKSIMGSRNMPDELRTTLTTAHNYIFLGMEFEKWYMQLLLRLLYLHNENYKFTRYASNKSLSQNIWSLYRHEFKIEFVNNNIEEFVHELYAKCTEVGILRKGEENGDAGLSVIYELVKSDNFEMALAMFNKFMEAGGEVMEEMNDDFLIINNRYQRLQKKIVQGVIAHQDADIKTNQLIMDFLTLVNKAKLFE